MNRRANVPRLSYDAARNRVGTGPGRSGGSCVGGVWVRFESQDAANFRVGSGGQLVGGEIARNTNADAIIGSFDDLRFRVRDEPGVFDKKI